MTDFSMLASLVVLISCNVDLHFFVIFFFIFLYVSDNSCIYMVVNGFGVVLLKLDLVHVCVVFFFLIALWILRSAVLHVGLSKEVARQVGLQLRSVALPLVF